MTHIYLESFGVKIDVELHDDALRREVEMILPPGWGPTDEFPEDGHFVLSARTSGTYDVFVDGIAIGTDLPADAAVHVLDAQVRSRIAILAPGLIFVHAGVVALGGRALLLPGPSFCGKSTIVAGLVSAGATYYSDEFALLDTDGLVHPYPRRVALRTPDMRSWEYADASDLGGGVGAGPARPSLIALTRYVPGSRWEPEVRKSGVGALALMTNAIPTAPRVEEIAEAVAQAAVATIVLEGDRGEAEDTAPMLLAALGGT